MDKNMLHLKGKRVTKKDYSLTEQDLSRLRSEGYILYRMGDIISGRMKDCVIIDEIGLYYD